MWVTVSKRRDGRFEQIVSALDPESLKGLEGLPGEAIFGTVGCPSERVEELHGVADQMFSVNEFHPNPSFSAFMHYVIRTYGPSTSELQAAAREQGEGTVCVIDFRTPEGEMGAVPPEDIIGAFSVSKGRLGEYHYNDKHLVFSENGFVQLPPPLAELHLRELHRLLKGGRQ